MKKLLLIIILLFSLKAGFGQYYTFTQLNLPYNNITGGTVISPAGWDYLYVDTLPFPFQFKYFGTNFDTFYVSGGFGGFEYLGQGYFGNNELFFYDAPLMDQGFGLSPISYVVTGTAPNRIVKLQIENAGFIGDQTQTDYMDVQVWFFETTNVIEIHNGPNSVTNPDSWYPGYLGPTVALLRDTTTFIQLYGSASNASSSTNYVADYVTGAPSVTNVYRFSPLFNGIEQVRQIPVSVFPNPSNGNINVNTSSLHSEAKLLVYSISGELVHFETSEPSVNYLTLNVPPGIYILKVSSPEGQSIQRLVISN